MVQTVLESDQISEADALEEIASYLAFDSDVDVSSEYTDDGYVITVSTALDEDVIYRNIG